MSTFVTLFVTTSGWIFFPLGQQYGLDVDISCDNKAIWSWLKYHAIGVGIDYSTIMQDELLN